MKPPLVHLSFAEAKWKSQFPRLRAKIQKAAAAACDAGAPPALRRRVFEINLCLSSDAAVRRLNRDWRGMDKPTNVLSFPQFALTPRLKKAPAGLPPGPLCLGDVILARGTVLREAKAEGKTGEAHTIHLIVHGILHLFGHDHLQDKDAKVMEFIESDILGSLGYPDPYHDPESADD